MSIAGLSAVTFGPDIRIDGFQNKGNLTKAWVFHYPGKGCVADIAFTQAMMAVDMAAKGTFGVIKMHTAQIAKTHNAVKLREGFFTRSIGAQIVPGGKGMARINTDTHPGFIFYAMDNGREMLKPEP